MVNKQFFKDVLANKKDLIRIFDVKFIIAPLFDEIGVKALYEKVIKRPDMAKYFPDKYPKGKTCNREYMYNIWHTIHPDEVQQVIAHANSQRYSITAEKQAQEAILISDKWMEEIEAMPFTSKTKGRMSMLLKQKSKVNAVPKERITYPAYDFEKRMRVLDADAP